MVRRFIDLEDFKNPSPEIVKRKITEGNHEVTLEIENQDQRRERRLPESSSILRNGKHQSKKVSKSSRSFS